MMLKHALATTAATVSMAAGGLLASAPAADAATYSAGTSRASLTCSYDLDETAGTLAGECVGRTPLGTATATFDGTWDGTVASGSIVVDTWFGDFGGTFTGTGWETGVATGTYRLATPFGTVSGRFGATA